VTNPCADNDFADLPHPFYYWYDWLPTRNGPDDKGRRFDCRLWLKAGDHYHFFPVKLERIAVASHDFSRLRSQLGDAPLSATILMGVTDHTVLDPRLSNWLELIGSAADGTLSDRAGAALKEHPPKDSGTQSFLMVLAEAKNQIDLERHTTTIDGEHLMVELHGRLKLSRRLLRARVWLGLTDIFGPKPPNHWRILRRGLAEDHIVVYWGHSGIGENFPLAQIEKHLNVTHDVITDELRRSPLKLVAFISCYSYMYFGQDLLEAGAQRDNGGYFIFTGMEFSRSDARPLAVLDLVDRVLRDDGGRVDKLPVLADDEFWLIKEVRGQSH
jgi:hypothetical protein